MDKLYYDDPLQAAWMAREFGAILFSPEDKEKDYEEEFYSWESILELWEFDNLDCVYIHPDSPSIFEPELDDLVEWHGLMFGLVIGENKDDEVIGIQHGESDVYTVSKEECRIIQRDNKAFFMPKTEATGGGDE